MFTTFKHLSSVRSFHGLPHGSMPHRQFCCIASYLFLSPPTRPRKTSAMPPPNPRFPCFPAISHWFLKGYTLSNGEGKSVTFSTVFRDFLDFLVGERTRQREPADMILRIQFQILDNALIMQSNASGDHSGSRNLWFAQRFDRFKNLIFACNFIFLITI